jgi:hypothetical protein
MRLKVLAFMLFATPALAGDHRVTLVTDPLVQKECGQCHMTFQPSFLTANGWNKVMDGLANHFGDNAELSPDKNKSVRAWLVGHAGGGKRAGDGTRITETRWFVHEHDFADRIWKRPEVGAKSNCPACHKQAEQGLYDDD